MATEFLAAEVGAVDTGGTVELYPTLIVDDDQRLQRRLEYILRDLAGGDVAIAVAGDMAVARGRLEAGMFSMALVDIGLPDGSGIDLIRWMQVYCPQVTTLVISAWGREDTVLAALRAGAVGYLLKERDDLELRLSLASVQRGGAPIDPVLAKRILGEMKKVPCPPLESSPDSLMEHLSEREVEILDLVSRGYSNREIADIISLSRFTVEGYTKSIYRKLSVGSRTAAVFEAKTLGLL